MRNDARLRRLGPALLAALVLCASLASGAHSHVSATARTAERAVDVPCETTGAATADLDCALCAAAARLAHGASAALTLPAAPTVSGRSVHIARSVAPPRVDLAPREARAPPRLA